MLKDVPALVRQFRRLVTGPSLNPAGASRPSWAGRVAVPAILAVLAGLVSRPLWPLGFFGDDFHYLRISEQFSLGKLLAGPGASQISPFFFTPLLGASFKIDWTIFGLASAGYTLHSLVWLWMVGLAAHAFFRAAPIGRTPSGLAAAIAMLAPATVSVSANYSTRHYLFGLAAALFCLAAAQVWRRRGGKLWLAAALGCYLVAALSKEIFVSLPVVALALTAGQRKKSLVLLAGFLATAAFYLVLRTAALGPVVGGYPTGEHDLADAIIELIRSWPRLTETIMAGSLSRHANWIATIAGNLLLAVTFYLAWRRSKLRGVAAYLAILAVSLGPVALILGHPLIRYADRIDRCIGDRLALGFNLCVLLGFMYLLFLPDPTPTDRRRERRNIVAAVILALAVAAGGFSTGRVWAHLRPPETFWRQVIEHRREELCLIGPWAMNRNALIELLVDVDPAVRIQALLDDPFQQGRAEPDYRWVRLHLPDRALLPAQSPEEARQWIKTFGAIPAKLRGAPKHKADASIK